MNPLTQDLLLSIASNYFTTFTAPFIVGNFRRIFAKHPGLESELKNAQGNAALNDFLKHCAGIIEADAGSGSIYVDNSFLEALRGISFNHGSGYIGISNSSVISPKVELGGSAGATGQTSIGGNTRLRGGGAGIDVGAGAGIKITGNAKIKIG